MLRVDFLLKLDYFLLTWVLVEGSNYSPEMDVTYETIPIFIEEREHLSDFSNLKLSEHLSLPSIFVLLLFRTFFLLLNGWSSPKTPKPLKHEIVVSCHII